MTPVPFHPLEPRTLLSAAPSTPTILRINAAGPAYTDSLSRTFLPDTGFTGGTPTTAPTYDVLNTTDGPLYLTYRTGPAFTFHAPVPDGHYALFLSFADPDPSAAPGSRVFDVAAEGATVLPHFDIAQAAADAQRGSTAPPSYAQYPVAAEADLTVADGALDLSFTAVTGDALVCALQLVLTDVPPEASPYSWQNLSDAGRITTSASNLRIIGQVLEFYANGHRGFFPPDLSTAAVYLGADVDAATFASPRTDTHLARAALTTLEKTAWVTNRHDFIYRGAGKTNSDPPTDVLAYENPDRVPGSINILYGTVTLPTSLAQTPRPSSASTPTSRRQTRRRPSPPRSPSTRRSSKAPITSASSPWQ